MIYIMVKTCPAALGVSFLPEKGSENSVCAHTWTAIKKKGGIETDTDVTMRCHLGDKPDANIISKYGTLPPCYINGELNPTVKKFPKGSGSGTNTHLKKSPAQLASCSALLPFGEEDSGGVPTLINDIRYFQDEEMSLLKKLQAVANSENPNINQITEYTQALRPFQNSRVKLMLQLNNVSSQTQCSLASDRRALQDQITLLAVVEDQLKSIEQETNELLQERTGKKRMVEITNYEYLRYNSHKNIFKTIAFCSLFVLAGISLRNVGGQYLSWIGYPMIIISIAVAIFLTIKRIWWNYYRNPMNWNQFIWDRPYVNSQGTRNDTVWGHDVNAFERGMNEASGGLDDVENTASSAYHSASSGFNKLAKHAEHGLQKVTSGVGNMTEKNNHHPKNNEAKLSESFAPYN